MTARADIVAANEAAVAEVTAYNRAILQEIEDSYGPFEDGTFEGESQGYGGRIHVIVFVKNGYVETINADEHSAEDPAYYAMAETILQKIIDEQSTEVDTVSGATFSSAGLKDAVAAALEGHTR